jgi:hypothetical protein
MLKEYCDRCQRDVTYIDKYEIRCITRSDDSLKAGKPGMRTKILCPFCMQDAKTFLNPIGQEEPAFQ